MRETALSIFSVVLSSGLVAALYSSGVPIWGAVLLGLPLGFVVVTLVFE